MKLAFLHRNQLNISSLNLDCIKHRILNSSITLNAFNKLIVTFVTPYLNKRHCDVNISTYFISIGILTLIINDYFKEMFISQNHELGIWKIWLVHNVILIETLSAHLLRRRIETILFHYYETACTLSMISASVDQLPTVTISRFDNYSSVTELPN